MTENPKAFYLAEKEKYESKLTEVKKNLRAIAVGRLSVFVFAIFGVYYFLGTTPVMLFFAIVGAVVFSFLLAEHWKLSSLKKDLELLIAINETELKVLAGEYFHLDAGDEFLNPKHHYSFDIDLFGKGSFFQYTNRTKTLAGRLALVKILTGNSTIAIQEKQNAIKELAEEPKWRQQFSALASRIQSEVSPSFIVDWLKEYQLFLPSVIRKLTYVFSFVSVTLIALVIFNQIAFSWITIWFFLGLGISGKYFKKINKLSEVASKVKDTFQQYYKLINKIEEASFLSKNLSEKYESLIFHEKKASLVVKMFSKALDALDQRNNLLISIVGNGLFLMDIKNASNIENWIAKYGANVEKWFEAVAYFDAQNSLANFAFNHQKFTFPEIVKRTTVMEAKEFGHPLLKESKRITSDCQINAQQFFIVTGANMAGKSTFLRTVSLGIVMANSGLPVCAAEMKYAPVKLITSMRTSDSLTEDSSYFFSELTRLKFIVEALKDEHYFIILDEILKGTNSIDKAEGSKKFVEKLVNLKSTGIIATHDLTLCEIEKEYNQIRNHYFDAEIINDELYFDYRLKDGVCQNMNASFLLKKMEIV